MKFLFYSEFTTAKSTDSFMRKLRFIGNKIKVIYVWKSRFMQMDILSLKFQRNFNELTLFCVSFANNLAFSDY